MHTVLTEGSSPIILSVPHDGTERFDNAPILAYVAKRIARGGTGLDDHTRDLSFSIIAELHKREIRPTFVGFALDRRHADPNRKPGPQAWVEGFEGSWREYHGVLSAQIERTIRKHGFAFLLDIHGLADELTIEPPEPQLILGTDEGRAAPGHLDRLLAASLKLDYTLVYSPDAARGVRCGLHGGYIVRSFGYKYGEAGLDAVQLEIHASLRNDPVRREQLAVNIAIALQGMLQSAYSSIR